MTTEIVQFKCPSCGHLLGEEEYAHACEKNQKQINEKLEEEVRKADQKIEYLKIQHAKELVEKDEKNRRDLEMEVNTRIANILDKERVQSDLKHAQELIAIKKKHSQDVEALKMRNADLIDARIHHAITENNMKHKQTEQEYKLQHDRIEADNQKLLNQVQKLQKTLDNIPPELRGTAGEFVLLDELKNEFRRDEMVPKQVGVAMADVVQFIVTETGERINNPIVYDKKMADVVTRADIEKAKNYRTVHNTDYSIIVTAKGIRNGRFTEEREGILLVHPMVLIDVTKRIREFIIQTSKQARNNTAIVSKQARIYSYVTSAEYNRNIKTRIGLKSNIDELQRREEDHHRTVWNRRRELITKWFELDHRNEGIIKDITEDSDQDQDAMEEDGDIPSLNTLKTIKK